jgi:hypothetical protein
MSMNLLTAPLLKPLFTAIARLPLIGPHGSEEVALLRSGAKPVGMFGQNHAEAIELQPDVDAGRLIRRDVLCAQPRSMTVYAAAGTNMDKAAEAAIFYMKLQGEGSDAYPSGQTAFQELAREGSIREFPHPRSTTAADFLVGHHTVLFVPSHAEKYLALQKLTDAFNRGIADGTIAMRKVECTVAHTITIIGQPGREQDMQTLAAILRDGYTRKPLPAHVANDSEGRILGYSDRDIAAFIARGNSENAEGGMNWLLRKTHDYRRDIRIALMKEAGPNWSRNP